MTKAIIRKGSEYKSEHREIMEVVRQIEDAKSGRGPPVFIETQSLANLDPRIRRALGLSF